MTDWRTTDNPPEDFTQAFLARRPFRKRWVYGVGAYLEREDGTVGWFWTGSGEPTHWAPITPPEAAP